MIRLGLYLLAYMIPGLLVGYLVLALFPYMPQIPLAAICILVVAGSFHTYRKKRKEQYIIDGLEQPMPDWIRSHNQTIILSVVTLLSGLVMFLSNKTDVYLDNGSDKEINIKVSHYGPVKLAAHQFEKISVVKKDVEFEYNDKKKKFHIDGEGEWIWNIDTQYTYIRTSVTYSSTQVFRRNGSEVPAEESPDVDVLKDEFFNAHVDYMFETPETINVDKNSAVSLDVKKKVLYHTEDWIKMLDEMPDDEDTQMDSTSKIATPKKKASK